MTDDASTDGGPAPDGPQGADAAKAALNRARAAAASKGLTPARRPGRQPRPSRRVAGDRRSGSRPDGRDPQAFGTTISRLVAERGWDTPVAVGGAIGRWDQVVGEDVAAHCEPETFEDGVLTVRTDSTAWATQMRLLAPTILGRLATELGAGVVAKLVVKGPSGPSWKRGLRTVQGGRGPRDTYG